MPGWSEDYQIDYSVCCIFQWCMWDDHSTYRSQNLSPSPQVFWNTVRIYLFLSEQNNWRRFEVSSLTFCGWSSRVYTWTQKSEMQRSTMPGVPLCIFVHLFIVAVIGIDFWLRALVFSLSSRLEGFSGFACSINVKYFYFNMNISISIWIFLLQYQYFLPQYEYSLLQYEYFYFNMQYHWKLYKTVP